MAQYIKNANIFGRIGSGIGQGLGEQIPKEIERSRLQRGLEDLSKNAANLTPFQRFAKLSGIPGITPQAIQSGSQLLQQEGQNQALINRSNAPRLPDTPQSNPYAELQRKPSAASTEPQTPSVTTKTPIEATIQPYIPKSYDQILDRAGELAQQNPQLYQGDPHKAIAAAQAEDQSLQAQNTALKAQRQGEQDVQTRIENEFQNRVQSLNAQVPGDVFNKIRDKAIQDVANGKLTEKQAADKYGKEIDSVSRDYKALDTLGNWKILANKPNENLREINSIQKKFQERNDLENFADTLIAKNGLSPAKAYYLAYSPSNSKKLNSEISNLPKIHETRTEDPSYETLQIAPKIAKEMGKEASPLAIAEELAAKGYDPSEFIKYVDKNRKELDLSERQARELDKPRNLIPTMNDFWLFSMSGLFKLLGLE